MKNSRILETAFSKYQIKKSIGQGGNGTVFQILNEKEESFAAKILTNAKNNSENLKRFKNEYNYCAKKNHKNIIKVIDYGLTEEDKPFFVMPLYESSLRNQIGNLSNELIYEIILQILSGVRAAHLDEVIHRDLKPENILLSSDCREVVITDFGIARFMAADMLTSVETKPNSKMANFQYAAPEQKMREREISLQTDIYSLGLLINELFTNELSLGRDSKTIQSVAPEYSFLDPIIETMLKQDPSDRPSNIGDILQEMSVRQKVQNSNILVQELKAKDLEPDEESDPLLTRPTKIENIDWKENTLYISLNKEPNELWRKCFLNFGDYTSLMGKGPEAFRIYKKDAVVNCSSNDVQRVVDYFKDWLLKVDIKYKKESDRIKKEIKIKAEKEILQKIKAEEERKNVLGKLKY